MIITKIRATTERCRILIFRTKKTIRFVEIRIRIDLLIEDDTVKEVRFSGHGCTISLAAASMLTEEIEGKSLDEVKQLSKDDILDMIGIPLGPVRIKCAVVSSQSPQSRCVWHYSLAPVKKMSRRENCFVFL